MKVLIISILLSGCASTTPDHWGAEQHRAQMMQCRVGCGKGNMQSYDSWTAECVCYAPKVKHEY